MIAVTQAGVDTWSPCWYVDRFGPAGRFLCERATVRTAAGWWLLPEPVRDYRVGWYPGSGLVFAEGHPVPGRLAGAGELEPALRSLFWGLLETGLPFEDRQRPFVFLGGSSQGFGGIRRLDATVNFETPSRAQGLAVLAGIAACVRDSPGHAEVRYGRDRAVETVYLRGYAGKRVLGRWYDKGLESTVAGRGRLIRGEDQRRWSRDGRRSVEDLTGSALRAGFRKRFYPLWKATKGVTVAGPVVLAEKLLAAVERDELTAREAESLAGYLLFQQVGGRRGAGVSRATMYRRQDTMRRLGLCPADGVLDEVEVDVGAVLEAALETDAWERRG